MKPINEKHFAILRRHMVEKIGIHYDLMDDELGRRRSMNECSQRC